MARTNTAATIAIPSHTPILFPVNTSQEYFFTVEKIEGHARKPRKHRGKSAPAKIKAPQ